MTKTRNEQEDPRWDWSDDAAGRVGPRVDPRVDPRGAPRSDPPRTSEPLGAQPPPPKAKARKKASPALPLVPVAIAAVVLLALVGGAAYYFLAGNASSTGQAANQPRSITLQPNEVVMFSGNAAEVTAAPANTVTQQSTSGANGTIVIRSTTGNASPAGTTGGAHVAIPADKMKELAGRKVRVTAWVRAAEPKPSSRFALAVAGRNFGTGWMVFTPTANFQPYQLDLVVPQNAGDAGAMGIWADIDGRDKGVELRLLTIRPLS